MLVACQPVARKPDPVAEAPATTMTLLSASAGVGGGNVRTDLDSASIRLPDYVPVRRYQDVFTIEGRNKGVFVEYGWDYVDGVAVERIYDLQGLEISRTPKPSDTLSFTDRELELAIALAREAPELRDLLAADDLNFYAGFSYRERDDPECAAKSRCVHVIVSAGDGNRHVAHAIVDLMSRRVVHPYLDPERKPDPLPAKS